MGEMVPFTTERTKGARRRRNEPARPVRIERIAVFRALQLGDLLCAVPALRALRHGFPDARITLIGLPSAAGFARRFHRYVDDWIEFPGAASLPEQPMRADGLPAFFGRVRARRFDLALQMHGSGERTNGIVRLFGARRTCGFTPDGYDENPLDFMRWPREGSEIERLLALTDHLGVERRGLQIDLPISPEERRAWQRLARQRSLDPQRLVLVHPGARLASRRWSLARYAALCDRLAARGWQIAITGSRDEQPLAESLLRGMRAPAENLCGATTLGELAAAISDSRLLVCNDTGVSHVAAAVGARSVVIGSGGEIARWRPLDRALHPMLAADLPCRPCAYEVCPYEGHPCANAIGVQQVLDRALSQLRWSVALDHA